jgi:hypothetical protein
MSLNNLLHSLLESKLTNTLSTIAVRRLVDVATDADKTGLINSAAKLGVPFDEIAQSLVSAGYQALLEATGDEPKKVVKKRTVKIKAVEPAKVIKKRTVKIK